jgi:AsmA protein
VVEVRSLDLRSPVIELIKNEQGAWNFSTLGPPSRVGESARQQPGLASLYLRSVSVGDGQVALTDRQEGKERAVYSDINASLRNLVPDNPFSIEVAVHLPGEGSQEAWLEGTGGPLRQDDLTAIPFQGTLELKGVSLAGLQEFLNEPVLADSDGMVTGKTRIDIQDGTATADGEINIRDARVKNVDLGYPITARYAVSRDLKSELLTIREGSIQLGATLLTIDGAVNLESEPPQLDLSVKTDSLSLAEVRPLAPALGLTVSPDTRVTGRARADIRVGGTTDQPALDGVLSVSDIRVDGEGIPQPVEIQSVEIKLTPTRIESNDFKLISGGTTVRSRITIREYASETSMVDASFDAPSAQLSAILALVKAYGLTAFDHVRGDGELSLRMRLSGPVQSFGDDSILRALHGESDINFNDVRLARTNLSQEVARIAGFLRWTGTNGDLTSISEMTGKITVRNGVAQTENLQATLDFGTIGVSGTADLVTQALNLRVNAVVNQSVSQEAGGTGIRGYLTTALSNDRGELVVPILVTGTFQDPRVSPDARSLAQMKLEGLLPSSRNPATGLADLVGDLIRREGDNRQQEAQPQEEQPQNPGRNVLQQILEGLSGGRKQPDPETPAE